VVALAAFLHLGRISNKRIFTMKKTTLDARQIEMALGIVKETEVLLFSCKVSICSVSSAETVSGTENYLRKCKRALWMKLITAVVSEFFKKLFHAKVLRTTGWLKETTKHSGRGKAMI
jgi:hypothetical protein